MTDEVVKHGRISDTTIMNFQCGSGLRKDCLKRETCSARHIGEKPGYPLSKYVKAYKSGPNLNVKCQFCSRSFSKKQGLKIHLSRCHKKPKSVENTNQQKQIHEQHVKEVINTPISAHHTVEQDEVPISWGNASSIQEIQDMVANAYAKIVTWERNIFEVPRCTVGKSLLKELIRLLDEYNHKTAWEPIALDLLCIFLPLMLQKPSARSKNADHVRNFQSLCLERY